MPGGRVQGAVVLCNVRPAAHWPCTTPTTQRVRGRLQSWPWRTRPAH